MGISAGPSGVSDGLVFQLDAANLRSYSGSGLTSNGLVGGIGGTLVNGVGFSSANNGSFIFDGTNDYIINTTFNPSTFSTVSLNLWFFKPNSWPEQFGKLFILGSSTSTGLYLSHGTGANPFYFGVGLSVSGQREVNINRPSVNQWHLVTGTWDGSDIKIYIDGVLAGTRSGSGTFPGIYDVSGFRIGYGYGSEYFAGNISQVQLYNRALSATEIQQNFNAMRERYNL
jgi:hypothetical protein